MKYTKLISQGCNVTGKASFIFFVCCCLNLSFVNLIEAETTKEIEAQIIKTKTENEQTSEQILNQLAANAINLHIRPGYDNLHQNAKQLASEISKFCNDPTKTSLQKVRGKFATTVLAFSKIEHIDIGPIMKEYRLERLAYWPDRKGRGQRAIQKLLRKQDYKDLSEDKFHKKSIALQGLTSLEVVLFAKGHEQMITPVARAKISKENEAEAGKFRCAYAHRIAMNIENIARNVLKGWQPETKIVSEMLKPSKSNNHYRSRKEVLQEFYQSITGGLKLIDEARMGSTLGRDGQQSKYKRALFWRSGLALRSLQTKIKAIDDLIVKSGFVKLLPTKPIDLRHHTRKIYKEIDVSFETFKRQSLQIKDVLNQQTTRETFGKIIKKVGHLNAGFARHLAIAADLPLGFNALDGD